VDRCAGVDWAKEVHRVCVLEGDGGPLVERGIAHDERGVDGLCELLVELGVKRVAIERPDGVLVGRLLEADLAVLPVHPNQLKAARPRFRPPVVSPTPSTRSAWPSWARTDHHRFRVLAPDSDETKALRALTRAAGHTLRSPTSRDGRDRSVDPYSSETIFFALGMEGALMLNSVTPSSMSFGIMAGSPAASPHIPTQIPASRAASHVFPISSKTAG
jgi:hypothetical protein